MHTSVLSPKRLLGSLVAVGCIAAVAIPAISSAKTASATAIPACTTSGLVVWMDTNGNGSLGHVGFQLQFTNLSGHRCTLRGFPGVSAVNLRGNQLGRAAGHDTSRPKRTIIIRNGKTAKALLQITDVGVFSPAKCKPVTAAGLRIFPPNQKKAKIVPFPFQACSRAAGPTFMTVRVVRH